jgi:hypothetical protein
LEGKRMESVMSGRIEKWLDGPVGLAMRARLAGGMKTWQWAQARHGGATGLRHGCEGRSPMLAAGAHLLF